MARYIAEWQSLHPFVGKSSVFRVKFDRLCIKFEGERGRSEAGKATLPSGGPCWELARLIIGALLVCFLYVLHLFQNIPSSIVIYESFTANTRERGSHASNRSRLLLGYCTASACGGIDVNICSLLQRVAHISAS
jgi:hypothetical protein